MRSRSGKCVHTLHAKALVLPRALSLRFSLSLERERERERERRSSFCSSFARFFSVGRVKRERAQHEGIVVIKSIEEETDDASSLSERRQKQQRTGELRFRFRASALKQSPSSDALLHLDGEEEEEDFREEEDQLARYVEPPELPHGRDKVFGTFLLRLRFLLTCAKCAFGSVFSSREMMTINHPYHHRTAALENRIYYADNETLFSFATTLLRVYTRVIFIVNNKALCFEGR